MGLALIGVSGGTLVSLWTYESVACPGRNDDNEGNDVPLVPSSKH